MVKFVDHTTFLRKKTPQKLCPFISVFMHLICLVQFHSCRDADKRNQQTLVVKTQQISMSKHAINSPKNMHTNCMNSDSHCQFYLNNKLRSLHFKTSKEKNKIKLPAPLRKQVIYFVILKEMNALWRLQYSIVQFVGEGVCIVLMLVR